MTPSGMSLPMPSRGTERRRQPSVAQRGGEVGGDVGALGVEEPVLEELDHHLAGALCHLAELSRFQEPIHEGGITGVLDVVAAAVAAVG